MVFRTLLNFSMAYDASLFEYNSCELKLMLIFRFGVSFVEYGFGDLFWTVCFMGLAVNTVYYFAMGWDYWSLFRAVYGVNCESSFLWLDWNVSSVLFRSMANDCLTHEILCTFCYLFD